ncbi:hypothetical protein DSO57_1015054 [Entomophthora muscae]|uniref:Uncharacterized protein n=1 Tax=Entomophthora muscae TaxID=34485 RepID=A0ACC2TT02_9FUNG|nr:hypothetical protein DSO57_1015054 [Entomophthora muscae]
MVLMGIPKDVKMIFSHGLFFLFLGHVLSIPAFHTVNDFDLDGQVCPLPDMFNYKCSPLCVKSLDLCPFEVRLQCKEGLSACLDGTCQTSCNGRPNVCACQAGQPSSFVPCATGTLVDIKYFNGSNKKSQVSQACSEHLQVSFLPWSEEVESKDDAYWAECPPAPRRNFTLREPMWVYIFSILGSEVLIIASWVFFKSGRERNVSGMTASRDISDFENEFIVKGYQDNYLGSLVLTSIGIISLGWLVFLAVLTADYYGEITGKPYGIALESYANSSLTFIGVWISAVTWFVALVVFKSRVRNWFRIATSPLEAHYLQIGRELVPTLLLDDGSDTLRRVRQLEEHIKRWLGLNIQTSTVRLNISDAGVKYFTYQCQRFVYRGKEARFLPEVFDVGNDGAHLLKNLGGISTEVAASRLELAGPNLIQVAVPNFFGAFVIELSGLFYLYQLSIMWLFYYLDYWIIGVVDTCVIFLAAIIKVVVRLRSENRIKRMAEHQDSIQILRDGRWGAYSTGELVPGDVFLVQRGSIVPCDAVLLQGQCVCDESSLTGEPLPVRKFAILGESGTYQRHGAHKINTLFAGTSFRQASENALALAHKTAISTDKGQLVVNILFPHPVSFIFDEQLKVVIMILGVWGIVLFSLSLWLQKTGGTAAWFYGMFCLSQILSPLLPAALVVGQSVAAAHLRKLNIFCVDLPRIMVAGKVQIFCFDKTGTLTHEGLDYSGSCPLSDGKLSELVPSVSNLPDLFQLALATCHSVALVDGEEVGNPVDIEMFKSTGWKLIPSSHVDSFVSPSGTNAHVIKRFEFIHTRASMSTAVLDPASNRTHLFAKGSFERLGELMSDLPEEYYTTASKLASQGCYVLALAHRDLGVLPEGALEGKTRDDLEKDIRLLGLIVFRNELKSDTTSAIRELKAGSTRAVMITGDTALTGIHIAQACEMIPEHSIVYLGDVSNDGAVEWRQVNGAGSLVFDTHAVLSMFPKDGVRSNIELAVTGSAFRKLSQTDLMPALLLNTRVFSRMTPQDKVDCVNLHMARGITAMCGDGGNDCGALSAAHVGLALSEAEASIVSPFSSSVRSIQSCVQLLRHGRAALANSFAGYKYLILYGETMAWLKIHCFYFTLSVSQNLWIIVDAFITVGFSIVLTQSKPSLRLSSSRPTSRLLGPETLASTIGMTFINGAFLMGGFTLLFRQPFFKCKEFDATTVDVTKWFLLGDNFEGQLLGFIVLFHFVNSAFIFNFGFRFRQAFWKNYSLLLMWIVLMVGIIYVLLADPNWLGCFVRMNCGDPDALVSLGYPRPSFPITPYNIPHRHNVFPQYFRYMLLAYCLANALAALLWETVVVLGPIRAYFSRRRPLPRLELKL